MDRYRQLTECHISADQSSSAQADGRIRTAAKCTPYSVDVNLAFSKQIPKNAWEPPSFVHKGGFQVSFYGDSIDGLQMIFTVVTASCIPPATNLLCLGAGSSSSVLNALPLERNDEPTACLEGFRMLYFLLLS